MPHIQTSLLNNAINRTETVILGLETGAIPEALAVEAWQNQMFNLGLIPNLNEANTAVTSGSVDTSQLETNIITSLTSIIEDENEQTRTNLLNQFFILTTMINDVQTNLSDLLDSRLQNLSQQINTQTQQIINTINNITLQSSFTIDTITDVLQQLFITQSNRIESFRDIQSEEIIRSIESNTNTVLDGLRNLNIRVNNGVDEVQRTDLSGIESLFQDLLSVLEDFRLAFINKDMSPNLVLDSANVNTVDSETSSIEYLLNILSGSGFGLLKPINDFLTQSIETEIGGISERWSKLQKFVERLFTNQIKTYDEMVSEFNNIAGNGDVASIIISGLMIIPIVVGGVYNATTPFVNNITTLARTKALDSLLSADIIAELYIRRFIDQKEMLRLMSRVGYSQEQADSIVKSRTVQLPEQFVRVGFLRGFLDKNEHDNLLARLGYLSKDFELMRKSYFYIPPVTDLIRFAVREAYDDSLAEDLQLDSGYDTIKERFENDLKQNGLEPAYGRLYWRSHWDLPSPTQGYEMLQRGIINLDELRQLLKVSDYSPQWIDKLIKIAYTPYTRVDIRRMHKLGVLSYDEVVEAYKQIGYEESKAITLADFTVKLNEEVNIDKTRDLSQGNILRAYKVDLLERNTASTMLQQLGYDNREATLLLDMQDLGVTVESREDVTSDNKRRIKLSVSKAFIEGTLSEESARFYFKGVGYQDNDIDIEIASLKSERNILLQTERVNNIMKAYIEYRDDENGVRDKLRREGFTPVEENDLFALWNTQRNDRFSNPTKADLKRWFIAGHITPYEAGNYLKGMGYDNKLVDLYLEDFIEARDSST